ncbi:hypothetical protein [Syntrophothermus lipocalidus]|uniref:Mpp6 membrane protein, palmitoylated 6 (MAGUK p55 subfamily member 6) n=1 Tax=Syntrophothermus lipocalidus (strain DSM 12680 / TGB-C1) TaxID=643648 RepID=D7CPE2_SYNLT|nr:hypothetical protein [Syntrophothermus lipocalidus]ADI02577.1 Mpp6; membrane protein, palmitoylated 6 (MAGUK p55 subfamily member 6) [Syntrophothermus lipocalidus DSM 12680]
MRLTAYFTDRKEAESYARFIAGRAWRYVSKLERDSNTGQWILHMYDGNLYGIKEGRIKGRPEGE